MHAGVRPSSGAGVPHLARCMLLLILSAGPLLACVTVFESHERPGIPEENVPGLTLLTAGENASYQNPSWSPDGRSLAYDLAKPPIGASRDALPADAEIYLIDLETGFRRQVTENGVADVEPDWSPDGNQIVFVRPVENSGFPPRIRLVLLTLDGSSEQVLVECPSACGLPKWSPDGEFVAFTMDDQIWAIRRDGSDLRQLSGERVTAATYSGWSPDGRRLAYWASLEATSIAQATQGDLAVLDLSTGEESIVFSGLAPLNPDWSPTGSSVLFTDRPAPQKWWTLFILDLETGIARRLIQPELEYDLFDAVWSPDGRRIAFAYGFTSTTSHLYILDLAELEALTPAPTSAP